MRSRIPVGKLTILVGDPGIGKSWASIAIASNVTNGEPLPGGENPVSAGSVLMWNGEDGTSDTIRPRAEALGADLDRFHIIESDLDANGKPLPFSLASVSKIEQDLDRLGDVRLIIIDPFAALMGTVDTYKDSQVRAAMQPLIDLAAKARVAVVCVMHTKKAETDRPIHRVGGSIGFVGAARSVLLAANDEVSGRSGIVPIKQNLAAPVDTAEYSICDGHFKWLGIVSDLPVAVLTRNKPKRESTRDSALIKAKMAILDLLSHQPMPARDLGRHLTIAGHAPRTVDRARVELKNEGEIVRSGGGNGGQIMWGIAKVLDDPEQAAMLF